MIKLFLSKYAIPSLLVILLTSTAIFAQSKGKVSGTVIDESGEPLIGVQVIIEGTTRGVLTDLNGDYSIINLEAGTYVLEFRYIGFATTKVEEVEIRLDRTTEIDVTLREEVIEGQEIVVTAERPIVEKDRTTTTAYVSSEQLEDLPIVSLNEAVNQQAGVVDGHFRGGRIGEVAYLVNGVPINNAFNNNAAFEVEQNMVSSLEVISGVFNAEYGQALSGVVNIVTKGVSNEWTANFLGYAGTVFSNRKIELVNRTTGPGSFLTIDDFTNEEISYTEAYETFGNRDVQFSVGGPIIKDKLGIQATLRYVSDPGLQIGRDLFSPGDQQISFTEGGSLVQGLAGSGGKETWLLESTGSGDIVGINYYDRYSLNTSFVYQLTSKLKLDYNLFLQKQDGRGSNAQLKYVPRGINKYYNFSQNHIVGLRYSIGQNSFANLSYSYLYDQGESYLYSDANSTELDQRYVNPNFGAQQGQFAFNVGGNDLNSNEGITSSHTIVTDFTSQINSVVLFKTGLSARFHSLDNENFGITKTGNQPAIRSNSIYANSSLEVSPYEAAGYSQVKLEFENLIVNAGLRFDYFQPDFVTVRDISQGASEIIADVSTEAEGDSISNRLDAEDTFQLSPRLGIAFPISETGVMRFSAGLFFQTPQLSLLYQNNEFEANPASASITYGNASLKPERTLSFEVGLQQGLSETLGMDLTLFSKDIRNLSGLEFFRNFNGQYTAQLVNLDYGTVKGLTVSLYERGAGPISWTIDYTLQFANGSASDPQETLQRALNGQDPVIRINRLNWDRRNVLNNTITWNSPYGLTISFINTLQSGSPYTSQREFRQSNIPNNADSPAWFNSNARAFYKPKVLKQDIELFVQVNNVFDNTPEFGIYSDTGLATESSELARRLEDGAEPVGLNTLTEWFLNPERLGNPRSVRVGLSLKF